MGCGASKPPAPEGVEKPPPAQRDPPTAPPGTNGVYRRSSTIVSPEHMPEIKRPSTVEVQGMIEGVLPERIATFSSHGLKPGRNGVAYDKINQDRGLITYPFAEHPKQALFCVYDGHGTNGEQVSEYIMWKVQELILGQQKDLETDAEGVLIRAFEEADRQLAESPVQASVSGAAAVVVLMLGNTLYTANAGDSRAVIGRKMPNGQITTTGLTEDQKPDSPGEMERILRCGGYVSPASAALGPPRVWIKKGEGPGLAMARSLGDHICTHVGVIPTPVVTKFELDPNEEYMLLLASDGVWEFIENEQAMEMAMANPTATRACAQLIDESSRLWREAEGNYRDDITAIVCHLPFFPEQDTPDSEEQSRVSVSFKIGPDGQEVDGAREVNGPKLGQPIYNGYSKQNDEMSNGVIAKDAASHAVAPAPPANADADADADADEAHPNFEQRRLTVQGGLVEGEEAAAKLEELRKQYAEDTSFN